MATADASGSRSARPRVYRARRTLMVLASTTGTGWLVWHVADSLHGVKTAPWDLGRAGGLTSYALLVVLVSLGLLLSRPGSTRGRWLAPLTRLRLHTTLAVFTFAFTVLHVVALATDPWAHVGWQGALLPMGSQYLPVGVTLGVIAVWSGLLTGVTAILAGRALGRLWWPVHKVAGLAFLLAWVHGVLAGSDTRALLGFYGASGGAVLALAMSRYHARTLADIRADPPADQRAVTGTSRLSTRDGEGA